MEWQFVVTLTNRRTEIPALLDGLQTNILSKCCAHKKTACPYIFVKI